MSLQVRPLELGKNCLPSIPLPPQAFDCVAADSQPMRLREPAWYEDSSEDGTTYDGESLHPSPLDLEEGRRRTGNQQAGHLNPRSSLTVLADNQIDFHERELINSDPKNKALPLSPASSAGSTKTLNYACGPVDLSFENEDHSAMLPNSMKPKLTSHTGQQYGPSMISAGSLFGIEDCETPDPGSRYSVSVYSKPVNRNFQFPGRPRKHSQTRHIETSDYRERSKQKKKNQISLRRVLNGGKIGKYVTPHKSARTFSPNSRQLTSSLEKASELNQQRLLQCFFGFDCECESQLCSLNNTTMRQIQQYLDDQPQPDSVINEKMYPLVCCVWLRNFIVDSLHPLDFDRKFDRGRLLGLQLKDESTQDVHRGFGLLWKFLEACGPKGPYKDCTWGWRRNNDKDAELRWFQVSPDTRGLLIDQTAQSFCSSRTSQANLILSFYSTARFIPPRRNTCFRYGML